MLALQQQKRNQNRGGSMNSDAKRKFQGVWIPAAIWLDRTLSITEKVMLVEINSLEQPDRGCYAGNDYFSGFFDLSKSRVSEIISNLASKGLIRVVLIREGKQIVGRQIWMTKSGKLLTDGYPPSSENTHTPPSEKAATPFGKGGDPSSEKAKGNNTSSNNTESLLLETFLAGINPQVARDFLKLRKDRRAILTETAMQGFIREARKANVSLEQALRTCCEQTWTGFRADWYQKIQSGNGATAKPKFDAFAFVNQNAIKPGERIEKPIN
jgi:hypothetical protein